MNTKFILVVLGEPNSTFSEILLMKYSVISNDLKSFFFKPKIVEVISSFEKSVTQQP